MKRNLLFLFYVILFTTTLYSQIIPKTTKRIPLWQDFPYESFGDNYPSSARSYSDIGNCLLLEGPGNNNPANIKDDANPALPDSLVQYIRRQFQYVIVDQDAYAVKE